MNLTPEQMLKLARIVYSEVDVIKNTIVVHKDYTWIRFEPSLTGTAEQKAQALDVFNCLFSLNEPATLSDDSLTAAAIALLSRCLSRRNNL